ncbi:hypothetical protein DPMN_008368 [Dreissena polymorpha]|uniref:Uncharacterized protein n=1 Tax=Dreissena polymorpha TaxID=45954 RepID=A0A9D4MW03_DREPO|nr:hypothetical protein DPMN_008368 [Dreissena polymorpha]
MFISPCSAMTTSTTYSLPYYHNLFSRSQTNDGKKIHATTYVTEIGTISSPVAGAPSVIQVKGQGFKSKLEENGDKDIVNSSSKRCGEHMNKLLLMKKDSNLSYQRKHDNDKDGVENYSIVLNETSSLNTCLIESTKSKLGKAG